MIINPNGQDNAPKPVEPKPEPKAPAKKPAAKKETKNG